MPAVEPAAARVRAQEMRWTRLAMIVAVLIGLAGPAAVPLTASASAVPTKRVIADNFRWCKPSPAGCDNIADENHRTKVVVGTRVKWIYKDNECDSFAFCPGHNVKIEHRRKSADVKEQGAVIKSMVFKSVGTFDYWCANHKTNGMTGRIKVVAG